MQRVIAGVLLLTAVGCSRVALSDAQPSAESLGREVLIALARRDTARLTDLALNEAEFRTHVWPGLPAARPERNVPVDYVWGDLHQKSGQMLKRTLQTHSGIAYDLESVRFAGATTDHGRYRVHRDAVLVVHDGTGERRDLRVLGSMIEADGAWKVFSYVVDN